MRDEPFESVLSAAREGTEWAWTRLYERYSGPLLGYLQARGAAEPEDLLGEVFLQLARGLVRFEGNEPAFRSWLFMIAHNRVIDEHRRRVRRPFEPTADVPDRSSVRDAGDEALDLLGTEAVYALLARLTEDQRNVLLLRIVADLTVHQTAQVLEKRPGAVKALQRRALRALDEILAAEGVPV